MPPKRKTQSSYISWFIFITISAALAGIGYLVYLWQETRQERFITYKEFGIPIPVHYGIHGIDVSRYQQRISWKAVKEMEVEGVQLGFAFIKATEGNGRIDPFFKRNWEKSKEAGIIRGAYHFFVPNRDGRTQAQNFINTVELGQGDLPPVLDIEQFYGTSAENLRKELKEWLEMLEEHYGVRPIIYTNADYYKRHLQGYFDDYLLWVAHYLQPHQPRITREWSFWQHSEKGSVNGITAKVDFNVFSGDSIQFKSLLVP